METSLELIENTRESDRKAGLVSVLRILGYALLWAFVISLTVGSFAAAVWTATPTDLLAWGSSKPNLLGYVSHCPFTPVSTATLSVSSTIGLILAVRMKSGRSVGRWVFLGVIGGMAVGLMRGIDIEMFIGMGAGVGIGIAIALVVGMTQMMRNRAEGVI
jgi:hypothetical protein